jgi:asparagine synthase (glutamine-hydrolysing)
MTLIGYDHYLYRHRFPHRLTRYLPCVGRDLLNRAKSLCWHRLFPRIISRTPLPYLYEFFDHRRDDGRGHLRRLKERCAGSDFFDLVSKMDLQQYLPDDILVKVDRMSMQNGLEVRCPLLDQTLVEYAARVPSDLKLQTQPNREINRKAVLKAYLRREIFKGNEPWCDRVLGRKKHGFRFPIRRYLDEWKLDLREQVGERSFLDYFGVREEAARRILDDCFDSRMRGHRWRRYAWRGAWLLMVLSFWWRRNRNFL